MKDETKSSKKKNHKSNSKKIVLNNKEDLNKLSISVLKNSKIFDFSGEYFDFIYNRALGIENNPSEKESLITSNNFLTNKNTSKKVVQMKEHAKTSRTLRTVKKTIKKTPNNNASVNKKKEDKKNVINNNINNKINNNINNNINFNNNFNNPPRFSQEYINQARDQMNNMTDEQLNAMITQMKNMDNQTLKNLMAAQGMNLSDQQIEMMKMSLSPELLRMVQNQNFQNPSINQNNNSNNNTNNNINTNINNNNTQSNPMPNLGNMDMTQMMEFIKKNPQLLKMVSPQLSKMMGGKDIDPEIMMKSMENIMWLFSIPGRIKRFMLSWRGICLIVFIIAIFYGIFKR